MTVSGLAITPDIAALDYAPRRIAARRALLPARTRHARGTTDSPS